MRKVQKVLALTGCAVLLVVGSVAGTLAYLTSQDQVKNTFTVGKVKIHLDEYDYDNSDDQCPEGLCGVNRDEKNKYHLLPGITYDKDPMVTVLAGSEDSYVRMIVSVENFEQLKKALPKTDIKNAKYYGDNDVFLLQELCVDENGKQTWDSTKWQYIYNMDDAEKGKYEFRYIEDLGEGAGIVPKEEVLIGKKELPKLFTHITVPSKLDNDELAYWGGWTGEKNVDGSYITNEDLEVKIVVVAHAIQKDGFNSAEAAWEAFDAQE